MDAKVTERHRKLVNEIIEAACMRDSDEAQEIAVNFEREVRLRALDDAAKTICVYCEEGLAVELHGTPAAPSHCVGGERMHCYAWAIQAVIIRERIASLEKQK